MITWGELQKEVIDLGFEEDDVLNDDNYDRVLVNATNRSLRRIYTSFVPLYKERLEDIPNRKLITLETDEDVQVTVPIEFEAILPLLVAHYIWLDDDIQKATMYWNEVDTMLTELSTLFTKPIGSTYVGGW